MRDDRGRVWGEIRAKQPSEWNGDTEERSLPSCFITDVEWWTNCSNTFISSIAHTLSRAVPLFNYVMHACVRACVGFLETQRYFCCCDLQSRSRIKRPLFSIEEIISRSYARGHNFLLFVCMCVLIVFQSRQDASGLWNSEVSSHGEIRVPMATTAKGGHWITLALPLFLPVSFSLILSVFLFVSLSLSLSSLVPSLSPSLSLSQGW